MRRAWSEAQDALGRAVEIAESIRNPRQQWLSWLALGRLRAAEGRRDDARHSFRAAWKLVTSLRSRTSDPGLHAGLESAPSIRELEDLARG
jgi:hypothetical protein